MTDSDALALQLVFRDELTGSLHRLATGLDQLRGSPPDAPELLADAMRVAHNIKGAARPAGHDSIEEIAHTFEDVLGELAAHPTSRPLIVLKLLNEGLALMDMIPTGQGDAIDISSWTAALDRARRRIKTGAKTQAGAASNATEEAAEDAETRAAPREVLVFEISGRRYGLDASQVIEIVRAASVESLPKAPRMVDGLLNVRGEIAPVFDLRSRLGLTPRPPEHTDHFIIARAGEQVVVVRADRAIDLLRLQPDEIQDAQDVVPGAEYISEVVALPEGLLLIYDLPSFLSSTESAIVAGALSDEVRAKMGENNVSERSTGSDLPT